MLPADDPASVPKSPPTDCVEGGYRKTKEAEFSLCITS